MLQAPLPITLLSRVEDAGLNASAPPQQRWLDGWLVRFSPGKAKRARCVNAVAQGRLSVQEKFALCQQVFDEARLPLIFRITPMSEPQKLDSWLEGHGLRAKASIGMAFFPMRRGAFRMFDGFGNMLVTGQCLSAQHWHTNERSNCSHYQSTSTNRGRHRCLLYG